MVPVETETKQILITGANRGIGWQVSKELAEVGHRVFLGRRKQGEGRKAVEGIRGDATWLEIDVADNASIKHAVVHISKDTSHIDVLINNAGIYPDDDGWSILNVTRDQLAETFQTNTFGTVEVTNAFLPLLRKSAAGRIINVSSGYGQLSMLQPTVPTYCLSKLALNGTTIMQAHALEREGIAVNSISPGWVRTEMGGANADRSIEEGAAGIIWLAIEAPQNLTGKFLRDQTEIEW